MKLKESEPAPTIEFMYVARLLTASHATVTFMGKSPPCDICMTNLANNKWVEFSTEITETGKHSHDCGNDGEMQTAIAMNIEKTTTWRRNAGVIRFNPASVCVLGGINSAPFCQVRSFHLWRELFVELLLPPCSLHYLRLQPRTLGRLPGTPSSQNVQHQVLLQQLEVNPKINENYCV